MTAIKLAGTDDVRVFESTPIKHSGFIVRWMGEFPADDYGTMTGMRIQNPHLRFEAGSTIRVRINSVSLSAWVVLDNDDSGQMVILPFGPSAEHPI